MKPNSLGLEDSLIEVLKARARTLNQRRAFCFLENGEVESASRTFMELFERAKAIAAKLQISLEPNDRVVLLFPQGLDFIEAFLGCILAKVIAVPAYPPTANRNVERVKQI